MIQQQLPPFATVAASTTAICRLQRWQMTVKKFQLLLGGTTFTKALINMLRVKIGGHVIWEVTGSDLDKINSYKGNFADAYHLEIDFSERQAKDIVGEEIGGLDMSKLTDDIFIEVDIGAAVAPTLRGNVWLTPPQGTGSNQLIKKLVRNVTPSLSAGRAQIIWAPQGALLQRMYCGFTGTDWTAGANGNVVDMRIKKNGVPLFDDLQDLDNREMQDDYGKTPQSKMYIADFIVDNNQSAALITKDAANLIIAPNLTAGDTLTNYFEVLDLPNNL